MEKGMIRQVDRDYRTFFPEDWDFDRRQGYVRRINHWVQHVGFRPLTGNAYRVGCWFSYLHIPEAEYRPVLQQELLRRYGLDDTVDIRWHRKNIEKVFAKMVEQFWPPLLEPLTGAILPKIREHLKSPPMKTWVDEYAMCVLSVTERNETAAERHLRMFRREIQIPTADWALQANAELEALLRLMHTPDALARHLEAIEVQNLMVYKAKI
jgi:hypothetical protein